MNNIFYVYVLLDIRKEGIYKYKNLNASLSFEPFYVGKGKGRRCFHHFCKCNLKENTHKNNLIKKIFNETGKYPEVIIVESGLTEDAAFAWEMNYIKTIGRINLNTGSLVNIDDGGIKGRTGFHHSPESKKKMSEARLGKYGGEKHPMFGRTGEMAPNYGNKYSPESRQKIRDGKLGKNNPNYGKKLSLETRIKMSNSRMGIRTNNKIYIFKLNNMILDPIFNLVTYCKKNYLGYSSMIKVAQGNQKQYNGYTIYKTYTKTEYIQLSESII